jgi:hypothetical protein
MSWTTDPGDAPDGDVEPAVHDETTSDEPARAADDARAESADEGGSPDSAETGDSGQTDAEPAHAVPSEAVEVEAPHEPDERLLAAHDVALAALREVTPEATIGAPAGYTLEEDGVVSLLFENRMSGYPGWFWTVSLARVGDEEPSVLELELLPGADALLAPEWVPWAVRLADYQAAQLALREAGEVPDAESDEVIDLDGIDLDDLDDLDAVDFDRDGSPILHAGDVDGVDIDELADSDEDEADADDEGFDDDSDDDESDIDDSDFVDDEDDSDDDEDDSDDDEDDSDDDEDDSDDDEDDLNGDVSEEDADADESFDEDDAAHGSRFANEHDQN